MVWNRGTPSHPFLSGIFHKPSIFGHPHFWIPPFMETPISLFFLKKTGYKPLRDFQVCLMCLWNPFSSTAVLDLIIVHANQREIQLWSSSSSSSSSRHHHHHHHQQQQHHHYTCMFPSSALLFLHDHLVFLHHSALLHMIAQVADEKRKEIEVRKTTLPARQLIQHTVLKVMDVSFLGVIRSLMVLNHHSVHWNSSFLSFWVIESHF